MWTPRPPELSTFIPASVPAVWPTPEFVMPIMKGEFRFRTQPDGADAPKAPVAHLLCGFCPRITDSIADIRPEQSHDGLPLPAHWYFLPSWVFTHDRARCTAGPPVAFLSSLPNQPSIPSTALFARPLSRLPTPLPGIWLMSGRTRLLMAAWAAFLSPPTTTSLAQS